MEKSLYDHCIETDRPALLDQWDTELNGELTPADVSPLSRTKVWWHCEKGHTWQAEITNRVRQNTGCPYCAGLKVLAGFNDLATTHPAFATQWHPTKNEGLTPEMITAGSGKKVWWRCELGHEWQVTPNSRTRTRETGCPVCSGRVIISGENDLATVSPALAAQWHPTKNGDLTPAMVTAGSGTKVWWRCEQGHEWQAKVFARASGHKTGCPVCAGKTLVVGENDLQSQFPHIAAQWHPTKNGDLSPSSVLKGSNKKVWWQCELGHEYEALISDRTSRPYGCPYCSGRRVLAGFNDLATKNPKLAEEWYQPLNGDLTPDMVTPGTGKKVWWRCEYGHVWQAQINSRTRKLKAGCPVCARPISVKKRKRL